MVAPTRVNEGAPQEPSAAEPPGPTMAELTPAETVTEDAAGATADLGETRPADTGLADTGLADTGLAGSAATEPDTKEAAPAEAAPAEAGQVETAQVEQVETAPADTAPADTAPVETAPAEAEQAEVELAEAEPTEAGTAAAEPTETELAGTEPADAEPAETHGRDVGPLAVVGIIVGVIALVGVAAGVLAMVTHGFKPKTIVTYRPAAIYGLRPGQCVNAGSTSLSFTLVSCTSPHDAEVFARFSLPAAAWPGSSAVRQQASDGCASRLSGYLNPKFASIGLNQQYVYPNQDAWLAGQRTVVCEVSSGNGPLTGSVRATS